ncbi:alpha/beta fold hydrolase [Nonomuraea terrae]|uniref:alpha/beta fold hydrolase n=1 Tax=Nonomuraea terrae TaxID=2530383 RepID=UPI001CB6DDDA|nr:alpha/beta fold hydrolase [Nonomuraea terrae]
MHAYDAAPGDDGLPAVLWHHGTPNVGAPPEPLADMALQLGLRWVAYDRPGYGASTRWPGRRVGSAAVLGERVADALGIGRFAVMGHSGGGAHALACAALLRERVTAAVSVSAPAPYGAEGLDWFTGMYASGAAGFRAALRGRAELERHQAAAAYDPEMFTPEDHAALEGDWSWFGEVVAAAQAGGPGGQIDDDLAYVAPWGCDPAEVTAPVLIMHGDQDRVVPSAHGGWLAGRCPSAELRLLPGDGHISAMRAAPAALEWLAGISRRTADAEPG